MLVALRASPVAHDADPIAKPGDVVRRGARRGLLHQVGADQPFRGNIRARVDPLDHGISPGLEPVDPAFHRVVAFPDLRGGKTAAPTVVTHPAHRCAPPSLFRIVTIQHFARDGIVTVGRDVRFHDHEVPDDTLGWKRSAVNLGPNAFHDNADPPIFWEHSPLVAHIKARIVKARMVAPVGSSRGFRPGTSRCTNNANMHGSVWTNACANSLRVYTRPGPGCKRELTLDSIRMAVLRNCLPFRLARDMHLVKGISLLSEDQMFKMIFSGATTILCVSLILCAKVGSAQTCQSTVNGYYVYSAIGNGAPGALFTTNTGTNSVFSDTPVGQLLTGVANTGPFASSGTLYLDGSGTIRANSAAQGGTTMSVGTYALNSDCTIRVTLTDAFGTDQTPTTLQGIILANGAEIDLGVLQDISAGTSTAPGKYQSNLLIKLIRPLATYCTVSNLNGSYALVATGTRVATVVTGPGTVALPAQTETPFFLFGRVLFDGNGSIPVPSATPSSLGFLQFSGSYTVNTDCTGTMTLNSVGSTGGSTTSDPSLSLTFVLTQPRVSDASMRPEIQFSQSGGAQTLSGYGLAQ